MHVKYVIQVLMLNPYAEDVCQYDRGQVPMLDYNYLFYGYCPRQTRNQPSTVYEG